MKVVDSQPCTSVAALIHLFSSEPFCLLLSHLTGLKLSDRLLEPHSPIPCDENGPGSQCSSSTVSNCNNDVSAPPCCRGDVFLWKPGCYTLMSDTLPCQEDYLLEVTLHFNADGKYSIA